MDHVLSQAHPLAADCDDEDLRAPHGSPDAGPTRPAPHASAPPSDRFRNLVDGHFAEVWRFLRGLGVAPHSVDDAAQHVFWIAAKKLDAIGPGSERAFLYGTALGVAANARRARARNREVFDEDVLNAQADPSPGGEAVIEARQKRAFLERALESMEDDLRAVFVLYVLEGETVPEISRLLGIATGTASSRLRRARESFHKIAKRLQAGARGGDSP